MKYFLILSFTFIWILSYSQNVGINANTPSEKLEVGGVIFTNNGGIKFPDSSLQTTAAYSNQLPNPDVSERRTIVMLMPGSALPLGSYTGLGITKGTPILAFNQEITREGATVTGGPGGAGARNFGSINIIKDANDGSVFTYQSVVSNALIPAIVIYFVQSKVPGGPDDYIYERLYFTNCRMIRNHNDFSFNNGYKHLESLSFIFETMCKTTYGKTGVELYNFCFNVATASTNSCPCPPTAPGIP